MTDSATVWLAIIAICSLVQTLLVLGFLALAWHRWRKAIEAFDKLQVQLAPTLLKLDRVADEVVEAIGRLRHMDDQVRDAFSGATHAVAEIGRHVRHRAWPLLGAINAVRAVASALAPRKPAVPRRPDDRDDESRFVYEGGTRYAR
jgi:hypothetical protein